MFLADPGARLEVSTCCVVIHLTRFPVFFLLYLLQTMLWYSFEFFLSNFQSCVLHERTVRLRWIKKQFSKEYHVVSIPKKETHIISLFVFRLLWRTDVNI